MEKAILKTLIYADLFDYPLNLWEIHRWLINKKTDLKKVDKALKKLLEQGLIERKKEYYFLENRKKIVLERIKRQKISQKYLKTAKLASFILRFIPTIKLIGISGSLALENAGVKDDIDLFLITSSKRIWLTRILALGVLEILGKRRTRFETSQKAAGKICLNLLLEENYLVQQNQDLYTAHEVLQMKVLHQKDNIYGKFLEDNFWVFKFLPNWTTQKSQESRVKSQGKKQKNKTNKIADILEKLAKDFQMTHIGLPQGAEKISDHNLYFHPEDNRVKILSLYKNKQKEKLI